MIRGFVNEYKFLDNAYPCRVQWFDDIYPSAEHAYHAAKSSDPAVRKKIREMSLGSVRAFAEQMQLRDNWFGMRNWVMQSIVDDKFIVHQELSISLLRTMPHELVYANRLGDTFWGVCGLVGENNLGKCLESIRGRLWSIKWLRDESGFVRPEKRHRRSVYRSRMKLTVE